MEFLQITTKMEELPATVMGVKSSVTIKAAKVTGQYDELVWLV